MYSQRFAEIRDGPLCCSAGKMLSSDLIGAGKYISACDVLKTTRPARVLTICFTNPSTSNSLTAVS
jgi:hypothetical protein